MEDIRYGDIVLLNLEGAKYAEQDGIRPALVIQNDKGNQYSPTVLICPITSQNKRYLPTHLRLMPEKSGLKKPSIALFEQVRVADKQRIIKKVGHIDESFKNSINHCLAISFGMMA